jgi:hypothetical protein
MSMSEIDILQERWRREDALHVNGITYRDGRVLLLNVYNLETGSEISCFADRLADTTVASVFKYNDDPWVTVTATARLQIADNRILLAGEGAMGNEGFVALEDGGILEWILFCTASNPFSELELVADVAVVADGYDGKWFIPVSAPDRFRIEHA